MLSTAIRTAKAAGFDTRRVFQALARRSLEAAAREQNLAPLRERLRAIVPDVNDQFSEGFDAAEYRCYWEPKMRGQHAFQIGCLLRAVGDLDSGPIAVADIGDSAGTHLAYLQALLAPERLRRAVSVNLDAGAVAKIRAKGGEAYVGRAEEIDFGMDRFDLMTSFEMLEHLTDPARFLHRLATSGATERLLVSVPYVRRSRVGLQFLRAGPPLPARVTAERVHIFELEPADWMLLCQFAGWAIVFSQVYHQYPLRSPLRGMAPVWRRLDFEDSCACR
jgi:SAM-dependent methyltransferase